MNARRKLALVAAIAGATLCSVSIIGTATKTIQNDEQVAALQVDAASAESALAATNSSLYSVVEDLSDAASEHAARQAVLGERAAFVAAVASADAAFNAAKDKVSVDSSREAVIAAQNTVLAEKSDPQVVVAQTAAVADIAVKVTADVKAHDERVAAAAASRANKSGGWAPSRGQSSPAPSGGGGDWFGDMRQRLNAVGGSHITLVEYDGSCGGQFAMACSFSGGTIKVHSSIAGMSPARRSWSMAHELAHQSHFNRWSEINGSAGYQQLFGSNPELLANCMASARGYSNHGHRCSGEMVNWAAGIWDGRIAW